MARPLKTGLDYFPLNVRFNSTIEYIESRFGLAGLALLIKIWQRIYESGYFLNWTLRNTHLLHQQAQQVGIDLEEFLEVLMHEELFERRLFEQFQVLTSSGIQQRYFEAIKRRKQIEVDQRLLLVDMNAYNMSSISWVNANINPLNANNNSIIVDRKPTKKRKEKKRKAHKTDTCGKNEMQRSNSGLLVPGLDWFCQLYACRPTFRLEAAWMQLSQQDKEEIYKRLPLYLKYNPNPRFRKSPVNYLNPVQKFWREDLIDRRSHSPTQDPNDSVMIFKI